MTLFFIVIIFCLSILAATMIALFGLLARAAPDNLVYTGMHLNIFKHWYWELIIFVIGALTMWLGFTKMFENDNEFTKNLKNDNTYDTY